MDADDLLMGPRGRRLCLQWVYRLAEEQAGQSPGSVENEIHRAGGAFEERVTTTFPFAKPSPPRPDPATLPGPADVARHLSLLRVREPTPREALTLLADTAAFAMYWQAPWGEDILATTGLVRDALRPIAGVLAEAHVNRWWGSEADLTAQWTVREVESVESGPEPLAASTGELLRASSQETRDTEQTFRQTYADRDVAGEWWSIPPRELTRSTRFLKGLGPVGLWVEEDAADPSLHVATHIDPPHGSRVLEIRGPDDWIQLCGQFPLEVTASRRVVWGETTGRTGPWLMPDWAAVAESGIDAAHLTVRGYLTAAGRALPVGDGHATVLAGWDPDATYWLTDAGTIGEPVVWEMDRPGAERPELGFHVVTRGPMA